MIRQIPRVQHHADRDEKEHGEEVAHRHELVQRLLAVGRFAQGDPGEERPQMNFINATVDVEGEIASLKFAGKSVPLPPAKSKKLIDGGYAGKVVTFGIRPEDVYDSEMYIETSPQSVFESTVKVYELLGAEVYLYFDLEEFPITARVDPRTTARPGDTVKFAFDVEKIHVFDKDTEMIITN